MRLFFLSFFLSFFGWLWLSSCPSDVDNGKIIVQVQRRLAHHLLFGSILRVFCHRAFPSGWRRPVLAGQSRGLFGARIVPDSATPACCIPNTLEWRPHCLRLLHQGPLLLLLLLLLLRGARCQCVLRDRRWRTHKLWRETARRSGFGSVHAQPAHRGSLALCRLCRLCRRQAVQRHAAPPATDRDQRQLGAAPRDPPRLDHPANAHHMLANEPSVVLVLAAECPDPVPGVKLCFEACCHVVHDVPDPAERQNVEDCRLDCYISVLVRSYKACRDRRV